MHPLDLVQDQIVVNPICQDNCSKSENGMFRTVRNAL